MRKIALMLLLAALSCQLSAQTVIDISVEQYPPLQVIASTVNIELPADGLTVGSDIAVEGGDGNYTYTWTDSQNNVLGREKTYHINSAGNYYLVVTDGKGCTVSTLFTASGETAVNGIRQGNSSISVTGNTLFVSFSRQASQVRLTDTAGRLVLKETRLPAEGTATIDITSLPQGVYIVACVYPDGQTYAGKITK
ncbi:MAG: T9SS type A sorting domain-containing protein [Prevotella sp.]|nr:T9SS type A sorting domain-containing protein [Prevotella sp.]